ncbi:Uncharacterized protein DAT39_011101 [Clarias magur]|uniref:Uncharacterized protein n=1 Tax=Clarias magur TaxID=1594786 RepID=A0A8J4XA85_CLAMG|nr:Uncharacterized protein DAT39_011101 [Clarias magur]
MRGASKRSQRFLSICTCQFLEIFRFISPREWSCDKADKVNHCHVGRTPPGLHCIVKTLEDNAEDVLPVHE